MTTLSIKAVRIAIDDGEEAGFLVFHDEALVAVIASLQQEMYGDDRGGWHLEAGFGACAGRQQAFPNLEQTLRWVARRYGLDEDRAIRPALAGMNPRPAQP